MISCIQTLHSLKKNVIKYFDQLFWLLMILFNFPVFGTEPTVDLSMLNIMSLFCFSVLLQNLSNCTRAAPYAYYIVIISLRLDPVHVDSTPDGCRTDTCERRWVEMERSGFWVTVARAGLRTGQCAKTSKMWNICCADLRFCVSNKLWLVEQTEIMWYHRHPRRD